MPSLAGRFVARPAPWPRRASPGRPAATLSNPVPSITSPSGDLNPWFPSVRRDSAAILKQQIEDYDKSVSVQQASAPAGWFAGG